VLGDRVTVDRPVEDILAYRVTTSDMAIKDRLQVVSSAFTAAVDIDRVDTFQAILGDRHQEDTGQEAFDRAASRGNQVAFSN